MILRIVKAGCHPVTIAQVVEHWQLKSEALSSIPARWLPVFHSSLNIEACADSTMYTVCCAGSVVSAEGKGGAFECMCICMYMYVCTEEGGQAGEREARGWGGKEVGREGKGRGGGCYMYIHMLHVQKYMHMYTYTYMYMYM